MVPCSGAGMLVLALGVEKMQHWENWVGGPNHLTLFLRGIVCLAEPVVHDAHVRYLGESSVVESGC